MITLVMMMMMVLMSVLSSRCVGSMWGASGTSLCSIQLTGENITSVLITEDYPLDRELFEAEEEDLFNELQALPRFALIRRFNDLIKRAKAVKVTI